MTGPSALAARSGLSSQPAEPLEVLVVGAGPVGLFTALHLARAGTRVAIVDEAPRAAARSYALALHAHTLALLDEVGLSG
jgi:2-polyprenyl-6-methoxyphenol hydroxylase-like FAD-dependent oxidoreductase